MSSVVSFDSATPATPHPPKRSEAWSHDETRALIFLRKDTDNLFNTSKSNKHLWENISCGMREKGFDRSPAMCTDKWRNLLKEFRKSKDKKMTWHTDIEELMRERGGDKRGGSVTGLEEKGIDGPNIPFGPMEASSRPSLNLERRLDHNGHPLAITAADTVAANGSSPWNWRDTPGNGEPCNSFSGRVITVKWGDYRKKIGIDGTLEAIKEAIKSVFRLRTKRAFWLEDEENIVRALDRDMPLGSYTLHLDEGLTIKVCMYEDPDHIPIHTEDKTFYNEEDFHDFISRRGWTCLREFNGYRNIDSMDDLCPGAIYRGVS